MSFRRLAFAAAVLSVAVSAPAFADVEKFMNTCDGQMCASFRASTVIPDGWVEDIEASRALGVQMLLPKGQTFEDAPAKIYTLVKYDRDNRPASAFDKDMLADWRKRDGRAKVEQLADIARAGEKPAFRSWRFTAPKLKEQGFERYAVTVDDDKDGNVFFIAVVLSANSKAALQAAEPAYGTILASY